MTNMLKIWAFAWMVFVFAHTLSFVILMIINGFDGTIIDCKVLLKIDTDSFKQALNVVLTLLALTLASEMIN